MRYKSYNTVLLKLFIITLILSLLPTVLSAKMGSLDTSLDSDGKVTTAIGSGSDIGQSVALQSDGKIVVAGYCNNGSDEDFCLARYNSDGSLDTSFDSDGKVTTDIGPGDDYTYSVVIQSDGKIIVSGYCRNGGAAYNYCLARYNSDGSLDTSFDSDGKVATDVGGLGRHDRGTMVTLQSDGKIVMTGDVDIDNNRQFGLVRYNTDGSLDTSFDSDGIILTDIGSGVDTGYTVALQSDGKIVVAGYSRNANGNYDIALTRHNSDGSLDTTFDSDGIVTTPIGSSHEYAFSVAIQSDGKIVVAGYSRNANGDDDFALLRYNSNGSLDTSFGTAGITTTPILSSSNDYGYSVVLQSDGKIVVAGSSQNGADYDFALARYNSGGTLDTSFDSDGIVTTPIGSGDEGGVWVVLQSNGKIVVGGYSYNGANHDFALVRYFGAAVCGDSAIEGSETCDDGNTANGDGCDSACLKEEATRGLTTDGAATGSGCQIRAGSELGLFPLLLLTLILFRRFRPFFKPLKPAHYHEGQYHEKK